MSNSMNPSPAVTVPTESPQPPGPRGVAPVHEPLTSTGKTSLIVFVVATIMLVAGIAMWAVGSWAPTRAITGQDVAAPGLGSSVTATDSPEAVDANEE